MAASPLAAALLGGNAGGANPFAYLDPQIAQATPNLQLGQELLQSGLSGAPAYPMQAVARLAQVLAGRHLQQSGISSLTQAYAHTADNLANIFPAGTPMGDMARSDDPTVRMMAVQQAGKAALLGQQGYNIKPGDQRQVNGVPVGTNTGPQSPEGKLQLDVERAKARQAISGMESGGN